MIQANELRVGNLTMQGVVSEINMGYFRVLNENKESLKSTWFEIEPIPLTEEWLVKFGFEKINEFNQWNLRGFGIIDISVPQCQYVHQLQNLYFALTGQELTPLH